MSAANTRWSAKLAALDANLLVALDALLQEANVTLAAAQIGITQSAMSQTLARLRKQFDDPILVRAGRAMQPTPFAMRIKARLRQGIRELEAVVRDRPGFDPETSSRRFVVATVDYLSMVLAPRLHRAIMIGAPNVDLAIHSLDEVSITPRLERGVVDLYLGVAGERERGLEIQPLVDEQFVVIADGEHPLLARPWTADEFVRWPHVHVSPRRDTSSILDRALAESGLRRRVAVEIPYFAPVPELLAGSELVATVPERIGRLFAHRHGLALLAPPIPLPAIEVCMAWHRAFARAPALLWLRSVVEQVAAEG